MSPDGAVPIDLRRTGTPEWRWQPLLASLPEFRWPPCEQIVVVSPHPDDETLGSGGLIAAAADRRLPVTVISVTDGGAAGLSADLTARRRRELARALGCLSPGRPPTMQRLGLPDADVARWEATLVERLDNMITITDLVICPLPDDGHPDHESCARATMQVASKRGAAVRAAPIWAWHWHEPTTTSIATGSRLPLTAAVRARKQRAISQFQSQLNGVDPVVPAFMLDRLDRAFEVFVTPKWSR